MTSIPKIIIAAAVIALLSPPAAQAYESSAKQAILVDLTGHRVLYEKNADEHMPTSSMSKMMTIYMVFDALKAGKLKLDDEFTVSEHAWRQTYKQDESSMFLPINSRVKVEDLIRGVIIQSGNDATVVLAEGIGGSESEFMTEMNAKAQQLGMTNSHFMNPAGMPDPEHYSTARDLSLLAARLVEDFPDYYHFFGELEYTYNNIKQGNRNPLLYHAGSGVDGLKTGHTDAGGYGLTASAKRGGRGLFAVVNGLPSMQARADDPQALLDYGFNEFKSYTLFKPGDTVERAVTWQGVAPTVPLVIDQPVAVTLSFAEMYWSAPGYREFDVALNSSIVLTNFDIIGTTGAEYKAIAKSFLSIADGNGQIVIAFDPGAVDLPVVNAIELFPAPSAAYTISGQVSSNGAILEGATVNLSGSQTGSTITDSNGHYQFTVATAGTYTVAASSPNCTFATPSYTFTGLTSNQVQNFAGSSSGLLLSGQVAINGLALAGVSISFAGTPSLAPVVTDANGNYSVGVASGSSYTLTPTRTNYTFSPGSQSEANVTSSQTGINFAASVGVASLSPTTPLKEYIYLNGQIVTIQIPR